MPATSRSSVAFAMAISRASRRDRAALGSSPLSDSADARTSSTSAVVSPSAHAEAASLERDDDAMDDLHRELFARLADPDFKHGTQTAVDLTLVGRYYERFADHAVSVARRVTFLVTGDYDTVVDREDEEDAVLSS